MQIHCNTGLNSDAALGVADENLASLALLCKHKCICLPVLSVKFLLEQFYPAAQARFPGFYHKL